MTRESEKPMKQTGDDMPDPKEASERPAVETELEMWIRELNEAGWTQHVFRGRKSLTKWHAPNGTMYRGPYDAWRMMKSIQQWGGQP